MLYDTSKKFPREIRINEKQLNELLLHEKLHYNYDIEPLLSEDEYWLFHSRRISRKTN